MIPVVAVTTALATGTVPPDPAALSARASADLEHLPGCHRVALDIDQRLRAGRRQHGQLMATVTARLDEGVWQVEQAQVRATRGTIDILQAQGIGGVLPLVGRVGASSNGALVLSFLEGAATIEEATPAPEGGDGWQLRRSFDQRRDDENLLLASFGPDGRTRRWQIRGRVPVSAGGDATLRRIDLDLVVDADGVPVSERFHATTRAGRRLQQDRSIEVTRLGPCDAASVAPAPPPATDPSPSPELP